MSDETFGPESRKPINPNEFQTPNEQQNDSFAPVRPPQIKGQIPPALAARLNGSDSEDESPMRVTEGSRMQQKIKPKSEETKLRVTGSSKLEELLEGIKESTSTYEKITLPSLGRFYDGEDGPADGILHIRPMTGEEESILATPRFVKRGDAVNMIFNKCIREKYKSENFLSVDRTFLLIWLRGISYSPSYEVELTCPFTDKKFSYTIDLNLDVNLCPDDFAQDSLKGTLPTTGYSFVYRLSRGKDELAIQAHRDKKAKFDNSMQADDSLIFRTCQLIEEIEGLSNKNELEILLKKLPVSDGNYIRNLVNDPPFGPVTRVTVNSPFTLEDFEVDLPLDSNFFFPRRQKTE
jgi:hypothetical protein